MANNSVLLRSLGALVAALWFFVLPVAVKPYWEDFWLPMSPLQRELVMNIGMMFLIFISGSLVLLPVYALEIPFFEQYKISTKPWAWRDPNKQVRDEFWALARKSAMVFVFNTTVLFPLVTFIKVSLVPAEFSPSFSVKDWPSYSTMAIQIIGMSVIHEFGFYVTHRLMHTPSWYRFHKVHHEWRQNTILASQHNHPVDWMISIGTPALLAVSVVAPHSITAWLWMIWVIFANVDDHFGYAFPWSPCRWFYGANPTQAHEFHHQINMGAYASKLNMFDRMFGSVHKFNEWEAERVGKGDNAKKAN